MGGEQDSRRWRADTGAHQRLVEGLIPFFPLDRFFPNHGDDRVDLALQRRRDHGGGLHLLMNMRPFIRRLGSTLLQRFYSSVRPVDERIDVPQPNARRAEGRLVHSIDLRRDHRVRRIEAPPERRELVLQRKRVVLRGTSQFQRVEALRERPMGFQGVVVAPGVLRVAPVDEIS